VTPHLLIGSRGASDRKIATGLPLDHFAPVREGLWEVVNNPSGTGRPVKMKEMEIAGKTGTAQVISNRGPTGPGHHKIRAHSWFVGFAPFADPKIVVAVLIENGGDGGDVAGPVARQLFKLYYEDYISHSGPETLASGKKK
jgi:penicillin-binding protein 2